MLGLLVLLVFAIGIALGEALDDNPPPAQTITRTARLRSSRSRRPSPSTTP
jgi:hypothetical protein